MEFLGYYIGTALVVIVGAFLHRIGVKEGYKQAMAMAELMKPDKINPVDLSQVAIHNEVLEKGYVDEDLYYARGDTAVPKTVQQMAYEEEDKDFKRIVFGEEDN